MASMAYCDDWGDLIDRPELGFAEIRWFDTTSAISSVEFRAWLERFVALLEARGYQSAFVDASVFRMDPALMDRNWRDEKIIPRYNALGVQRFAFQMPEKMPLVGTPPAPDGPAIFPTGYFATRQSALHWLADAA